MRIERVAVIALALAAGACVSPVRTAEAEPAEAVIARRGLAMRLIEGWHETSRLAARLMVQRYGVPDEVHYGRLVWRDSRPWTRTVVRDISPDYGREGELGVLEQSLDYPLSAAQAAAVEGFDPRLRYDPATATLSSRADREEVNFLRVNLADDIAGRGLDVASARAEFAREMALEQAGKSSPAMAGLRFLPVKVSRP